MSTYTLFVACGWQGSPKTLIKCQAIPFSLFAPAYAIQPTQYACRAGQCYCWCFLRFSFFLVNLRYDFVYIRFIIKQNRFIYSNKRGDG